jgi:hypothetical protein
MFDTEFKYFVDHQDELVALYNGRVLVLQGERVIETHATLMDAYLAIKRAGLLGKAMLQKCIPGPEAYTAYVSTPGLFA